MSKKTSGKKELIIGGVVAGLMMGGTAMASLKGAQAEGELFKIRELKSGYQLAAAEKKDTTKVTEEKACRDKSCKGKGDEKKAEPGKTTDEKMKGEKHCCDKSCKDKSCKDKTCKDKSCKDKSCKEGSEKADKSKSGVKVKEEMACGEKSCSGH